MVCRGHVPIRTCVVCRSKKPKFALRRMVLEREERHVVLDCEQRLTGRGAYVCPECLPRMRFTKPIRKAFRDQAAGLAKDSFLQSSGPTIAGGTP